ncbi:type 1 fimbrial protein [Pseudomonas sp. RC4D1]|uniref:fimbrial protein n=1 Tax=Pseudomonas sp. RC4D1 TaxID=2834407 RepID=UPI001BCF3785|nr:fimbrial protein [Pseudomonas sp. RC4D1]MBS7560116.1 type 1 fimbrial protein [Pseudomonas sp. RC4D1]
MKKQLFALAVLTAVGITPAVYAAAGDGTINFKGAVTGQTCTIGVNGGGASPSVALPDVSGSNFTSVGVTQGATNIDFALTNCVGTAVKASVYFGAGTGINPDGTIANSATGATAAKNVALQIIDGNSRPVIIGSSTQTTSPVTAPIVSGAATLKYAVQYIATTVPVVPGTVSGAVTYSINYL